MEKKKLLLVAVSVGVVLLFIIGIPLLIIAPRQGRAEKAQAAAPVEEFSIEPTIIAAPEIAQEIPKETPPAVATQPPGVPAPQVTTLTVPVPHTVAVPDYPVAPPPRAVARPAPAKPAPAKPAVAAKPAPKPAAKAPAAPKKESQQTFNNYWVQTGAFSTQVRAEGAKDSLADKGITSIIDNRDIGGKTWYRVRVGPYTTETEANYWLALVKTIDGFGESQVRQSVGLR